MCPWLEMWTNAKSSLGLIQIVFGLGATFKNAPQLANNDWDCWECLRWTSCFITFIQFGSKKKNSDVFVNASGEVDENCSPSSALGFCLCSQSSDHTVVLRVFRFLSAPGKTGKKHYWIISDWKVMRLIWMGSEGVFCICSLTMNPDFNLIDSNIQFTTLSLERSQKQIMVQVQ